MIDEIVLGKEFTVSKTDNRFIGVKFNYKNGSLWEGCFPIFYPPMLIQYDLPEDQEKLKQDLEKAYEQLNPDNISASIDKTKTKWTKPTTSETFKVFESLLTGYWECRSCGAGKINDQPAARIRDIKKNGFIIATQSKGCPVCQKKQYHDILLPIEVEAEAKVEFRKPISASMMKNIIEVLERKDVFFDAYRPPEQFVIDHKFPSQRWTEEESDNDNLSDDEIKEKFQLLTNQSNMLKSRLCDNCCRTGKRPDFLGVKMFYSGNEDWVESEQVGSGCHGCPWYDLGLFKKKLNESIK